MTVHTSAQRWTATNDRELRELVARSMTLADIARQAGRTANAVQQRIKILGLSIVAARKASAAEVARVAAADDKRQAEYQPRIPIIVPGPGYTRRIYRRMGNDA